MQSYFLSDIRGCEKSLRRAQIPFEPFQIGTRKGLVFDDTHLTRVLAALHSTVERQQESQYDGVHILHLKRGRKGAAIPVVQATVRVEKWSSEASQRIRENFVSVAQEFVTSFGVREIVLIDVRNGEKPEPVRTGTGNLNIFFWSSARGESHDNGDDGIYCAAKLWEFVISEGGEGRWRIWHPSGEGLIIKDPAGVAVAELVGENLYIYYPITNDNMPQTEGIFRRILEETALLGGLNPKELRKRRLEQERRREEELRAELQASPVTAKRWNGSRGLREKFVAIATEFVQPLGGRPIYLYNYCDNVERHRPSTDGRIHICIWSSSDALNGDGDMKKVLFGAPLKWDGDGTIIKPSGEGGTILLDEDGNQFGKVMDDTIYIHYPLAKEHLRLDWDGKGPEALFRRILEEIVFLKTATKEEKEARALAVAEKRRVRSREEYVRACNGRFEAVMDMSRRVVKESSDKVRGHQQAIVKLIRESKEAQGRLDQMEHSRAESVAAYTREFDNLIKVPKIRDVRVSNEVVNVFTDTLYCVDPRSKKRHEIGAFRIEMHLGGQVLWFNLTRTVRGIERDMNAPHVYASGKACLGNMSEVIPELIANYEFAALAMVSIQFIENVNVDDAAGECIKNWPVAAEEEKQK